MKRRWISTPWTAEKLLITCQAGFKTIRNKSLRCSQNERNQLVFLFYTIDHLCLWAYFPIISSTNRHRTWIFLWQNGFQIQNNKFRQNAFWHLRNMVDSRYNETVYYHFVVKCGKINEMPGNFISVISFQYTPITIHMVQLSMADKENKLINNVTIINPSLSLMRSLFNASTSCDTYYFQFIKWLQITIRQTLEQCI
jgi:hypothetical protein